uniref:serine hydrolase domain-containing protein n=1 Tax=unclassified Variovorax TaxID=663243 RepID=UPI000D43AC47
MSHPFFVRALALGRTRMLQALAGAALGLLAACGGGGHAAPLTAVPGCPGGQVLLEAGCTDTAQVAELVRGVVRDTMPALDLRSAIVSVAVGDTPVLTEAWGESAPGQPATTDMHWRIGSIAIAYQATALLQLQDRGLLGIDDKLSKWLPDYPHADEITLAMLANSTSGYADYVDLAVLPLYQDVHRQWTENELVEAALSQPMKCAPGTCFSYAHTNLVILGRVMAMASGQSVASLIRSGILEPLALHDTRSDSTAFIPAPVLHAFSSDRGRYEDSTDWNPSWTIGDGAIMTGTVPDVMRSAAAIATGRLVSPKSFAQLLAPRTAGLAPMTAERYYGLGILVSDGWVFQNPFFFGYSGVMAYLPAQKISIAVTTTLGPASPEGNTSEQLFKRIATRLAPSRSP